MQPLASLPALMVMLATATAAQPPWPRHTIDDSSRGADGVRLADVNGDDRPDIVTGWEEGGVIRVYTHPGSAAITHRWPWVTVGTVSSPEDAVFVDLNQDGAIDVVSCCEGRTRAIFLHRAPASPGRYLLETAWTTHPLTGSADAQPWMFCLPLTGPKPPVLIAGSKGSDATISRLVLSRDGSGAVKAHRQTLCAAGWIMSLRSRDMDRDGDLDVLFSDRKGPLRGIGWLEQPAEPDRNAWPRHVIGGVGEEVMFLDVGDLDGDGADEIVAATRSAGILVCAQDHLTGTWNETMIPQPPECGTGKGVAIADVDQDGRADVVVSCENAADRHGVFWLSKSIAAGRSDWEFHPISGAAEGIKFDRIELLDLDEDGDLDVLTCEERDNLGVIWYENPVH